MVTFVEVTYGAELSYPPPRSTNMGAMIGKSSTLPTTNPTRISTTADLTSWGISSTSQLYKALEDFIAAGAGSSVSCWAYAVSTSPAGQVTVTDQTLLGQINTTNYTFYSPIIPCVGVTGVEINFNNSGWYSQHLRWNHDIPNTFADNVESIWTTGVTNSMFDGRILFANPSYGNGTGLFVWSGAAEGACSGINLISKLPAEGGTIALRADIQFNGTGLGDAFEALKENDYDFNIFTFAYDQDLSCPADPNVEAAFKYASGQCYGMSGWLHDVTLGKNMSAQLNSVGKRAVFYFSLPSNVRENTKITGYAVGLAGNTYTGTTSYGDLYTVVGNSYYAAAFVDKQTTAGADLAACAMATSLKELPRTTLMYANQPSNIAQSTYPTKNEILAWRNAKINPLIKITRNTLSTYHFGGNSTFGSGNEKDINFVRCRALLANSLIDNLQTLLLTRNLKYDLDGITKIKDTIIATQKDAKLKGYIDGVGTVTIPIEGYLQNEAGLDAGQKIVLNSARQSKVVGDINITFVWNGDIEEIVVRSLSTQV